MPLTIIYLSKCNNQHSSLSMSRTNTYHSIITVVWVTWNQIHCEYAPSTITTPIWTHDARTCTHAHAAQNHLIWLYNRTCPQGSINFHVPHFHVRDTPHWYRISNSPGCIESTNIWVASNYLLMNCWILKVIIFLFSIFPDQTVPKREEV